jgi:NADPH:quinone reductase-like Zn-dependent oxidoreductase
MNEAMTRYLTASLTASGDGAPRVRLDLAPDPGPAGPGEVVLAMALAPINPADLLLIDGGYAFAPTLPAPLGAEGVGVVVDAGPGSGFTVGMRALPLVRGTWAQRLRLPAEQVLACPPEVTLEQAAGLRINPATAARLLGLATLTPGEAVVQNAGASSVGRHVAALAARAGLRCLSVLRRLPAPTPEPGEAWLEDGEDLAQRAAEAAQGAPVRLALDAVAGAASARMAACLAPGGVLGVYGHLSGEPCQLPSTLLTGRGLTVKGFSLRPSEAGVSREALARFYAELAPTAATVPVRVAQTYPLADLAQALAHARDPARRGKVMLDLQG